MGNIMMGRLPRGYRDGNYQSITFCVTEECNLRCKYCYMPHKNGRRRMSFEVAKKAVDFFLAQEPKYDAVAWDFIGGEPTLEMDLIDKLCDYIKVRMYELNHVWFNNYMFSFSSNGVLYNSKPVQNYIAKNRNHISFGISIDGNKVKHDMQRVYQNGLGSYDDVARNIPLWLKQFPNASTKVTFASADLIHLKDSIIHLWGMGLKLIPANIVFEDVWQDGDDQIYEEQLRALADYILDNHLWEEYSVRFFDPNIGFPLGINSLTHNFCGAGKMSAVDCDGKIFPCIRFLDFCMPDETVPPLCMGDIDNGINEEISALFKKLNINLVSDDECRNCPIAEGCFACAGNNYCYTESNTIFKRTKFHCQMHHAQIRANEYFWDKLAEKIDEPTPHELARKTAYESSNWNMPGAKYLYFVLNGNILPHCSYTNNGLQTDSMTQERFDLGIKYAYQNNMLPVFLGDPSNYLSKATKKKWHVCIDSLENINVNSEINNVMCKYIPIINRDNITKLDSHIESCILLINKDTITWLPEAINLLYPLVGRINIFKQDISNWGKHDFSNYRSGLTYIRGLIEKDVLSREMINIFDDSIPFDCHAGKNAITYAPNGNLYLCPAFYFNQMNPIGNITEECSIPDRELLWRGNRIGCSDCVSRTCQHCSFLSKTINGTVNVPTLLQCKVGKMELEASNAHIDCEVI